MIGRKLSHFRILDRIREGGMGVVYRAGDEKLQRVVALKLTLRFQGARPRMLSPADRWGPR